jgi:hypothetical protein
MGHGAPQQCTRVDVATGRSMLGSHTQWKHPRAAGGGSPHACGLVVCGTA